MVNLSVADLIDNPSFGMSVLAGADHVGAAVRWVHISSTPEMAQWIEAGDVVLTGGRNLPRDVDEQRDLVRDLVRRGAAALAIGSVEGPEDISGLRAGADAHGLALVWVDRSVPWGALGRAVADANDAGMRASLRDQVRIFETLEARVNGEIDFTAALRLHGRITGYEFFLVNDVGRPSLPGLPALPEDLAHALRAERPLIPEGFAVPVRLGGRRVATLVARQVRASASGLTALRHVATLAATELADVQRQREITRRQGADVFARMRTGRLDAAAADLALQDLGIERRPWVLARVPGDTAVADAVARLLSDEEVAHLLVQEEGDVDLLVAHGVHVPWEEISGVAGAVVALSAPVTGLEGLAVARRQVKWVRQRQRADATTGVVAFDASIEAIGWLPPERAALHALVRSVVGPVLDYDDEHGAQLLATLRSWLQHNRSVSEVADELFVHRQTVGYRLRRISELTGRDLRDVGNQAQLWLAVHAVDVLSGDLPVPGPEAGLPGQGAAVDEDV